MARTVKEIYNEMVLEKQQMTVLSSLQPSIDNAQNLLSDLTTQSKVAIWRLLFFVTAVAIWVHEKLFDRHKAEIEIRANELITGTARWYREQCFVFQYGDAIQWVDNKYTYPRVNPANQIIKRAAVIEAGGQVRIKVAKLDTDGLPAPLSVAEITAFKAYIGQIKFAGTSISVISRDADLLKVSFDVVYDPLVMNGIGELIIDPSVKPVESAINDYIQNLPFNGVLNLTSLTDAVQQAEGVIDPVLNGAAAKYGRLAYQVIDKKYNADAGHMKIDPAHPLSPNINYLPNV